MRIFFPAVIGLSLSLAQSQVQLKVADASSSGTYHQLFTEMKETMIQNTAIDIVESNNGGGALENLDALLSNKVNACFVHADVVAWKAKTEDLTEYKTLLCLHQEDVHILALNQSVVTENGVMGYGKKTKNLNQLSDLSGLTVGAAGGGWVTANLIRLLSEVQYNVAPKFASGHDVIDALNNGSIQAAIFVGAAPLPNLEKLDSKYKLISIPDPSKLKSVYKPSTVSYLNINTSSVATVSVPCILLSKTYKTPKFVSALSGFRKAFCTSLDELKETVGKHKAWQRVNCSDHGPWAWYEMPSTGK